MAPTQNETVLALYDYFDTVDLEEIEELKNELDLRREAICQHIEQAKDQLRRTAIDACPFKRGDIIRRTKEPFVNARYVVEGHKLALEERHLPPDIDAALGSRHYLRLAYEAKVLHIETYKLTNDGHVSRTKNGIIFAPWEFDTLEVVGRL